MCAWLFDEMILAVAGSNILALLFAFAEAFSLGVSHVLISFFSKKQNVLRCVGFAGFSNPLTLAQNSDAKRFRSFLALAFSASDGLVEILSMPYVESVVLHVEIAMKKKKTH